MAKHYVMIPHVALEAWADELSDIKQFKVSKYTRSKLTELADQVERTLAGTAKWGKCRNFAEVERVQFRRFIHDLRHWYWNADSTKIRRTRFCEGMSNQFDGMCLVKPIKER